MLPRIKISYLNGQLGTVGESPDGLFALVCGATAVGGTFELEKAYSVRGMDDLAALGITSEGNPRLYKHVKEFYDEAEEGTELVVYGVAKSAKMTALLDKTSGSARKLVEGQNGRLRGVFVAGDGGQRDGRPRPGRAVRAAHRTAAGGMGDGRVVRPTVRHP